MNNGDMNMTIHEQPTYADLQSALHTTDLWLKTLVEKLNLDPNETRFSVTVQPTGKLAAEASLSECLNKNTELLKQMGESSPVRHTTREEAGAAAAILLHCNGHDLSTWTNDLWPDDTLDHALKLLSGTR